VIAAPAVIAVPSRQNVGTPSRCQRTSGYAACVDQIGSGPAFRSIIADVPYVIFTSPGARRSWPIMPACWSPMSAASGIDGTPATSMRPSTALESTTAGSAVAGTRSASRMAGLQPWDRKS